MFMFQATLQAWRSVSETDEPGSIPGPGTKFTRVTLLVRRLAFQAGEGGFDFPTRDHRAVDYGLSPLSLEQKNRVGVPAARPSLPCVPRHSQVF